jgi:hypothetical protein
MITPWLSQEAVEAFGELMYIVSLLASLAIAWRMYGIWSWWGLELAAGLCAVSVLFALYWLYCLVRIHTGCMTGSPGIEPWLCSEMAFWTRLMVAVGLSAVATWAWWTK